MAYRYEDSAQPGVQNPAKYKIRPGPNYAKWGEQPGYIYNPYTDHYDKPRTEQEMYEAGVGKKPAGDPSLLGTVGTIAGAGLALEGGKALGLKIPSLFEGGTPTPSVPNSVPSGGTPQPSGLLGTGAGSASLPTPQIVGTNRIAVTPIQTKMDGSVLMSDGSVQAPGTTTGQYVQGVGGLLQLGQGINQFQNGDKVGGTINSTAGLANVGTAAGSQTAATVVPGANIAAGLYGGFQTAKYLGDAAASGKRNSQGTIQGASSGAALGAGVGAMFGGVGAIPGALIGAGIGGLAGLAGALTGSSKGKEQMQRDKIRKGLEKLGLAQKIEGSHFVTLADGSKFNIGLDGGAKLQNADGKTKRNYFDVDFSNSLGGRSVELLKPRIQAILGEKASPKMVQDWTGYYSNAALSNAKSEQDLINNINSLLPESGIAAAQQPRATLQSNGKYRVSPGVYVDKKRADEINKQLPVVAPVIVPDKKVVVVPKGLMAVGK